MKNQMPRRWCRLGMTGRQADTRVSKLAHSITRLLDYSTLRFARDRFPGEVDRGGIRSPDELVVPDVASPDELAVGNGVGPPDELVVIDGVGIIHAVHAP